MTKNPFHLAGSTQVRVYGYRIAEGTVAVSMLVVEPGGNATLQGEAEAVIRTLRLLATPQVIAEYYDVE